MENEENTNGLYTVAQLERILGKKRDTLKRWFSQGCPHQNDNGKILANAGKILEWRLNHERENLRGDGEMLVLEEEKAKLAREQYLEKAIKNKMTLGDLVEVEMVNEIWAQIILAARAKFLSIGSKVAARMNVPNQRILAVEIDKQVKSALKELSENWQNENDEDA